MTTEPRARANARLRPVGTMPSGLSSTERRSSPAARRSSTVRVPSVEAPSATSTSKLPG